MFRRSAAAPALSRQLALSQETAVGAPSAAYSRLAANRPTAWVNPASNRSICRRQSIIASPRAAGGASAKKATTASAAAASIAMGEGHQVGLVASAFGPPGEGPARRQRLVEDFPLAFQLLPVDLLHHLAHQAIELGQDLGQLLAIVLDPPVQLEVGRGHAHRAR